MEWLHECTVMPIIESSVILKCLKYKTCGCAHEYRKIKPLLKTKHAPTDQQTHEDLLSTEIYAHVDGWLQFTSD